MENLDSPGLLKNNSETPYAPLVSVIVPCYQSERTIRRCLHAIANQQTTVPFEIIVVDSSTDHTSRIVAEEFPDAQLIHLPERTYAGKARNYGIRAARGTYCLMIDSDCLAAPDVIERMLARHAEANYAAVSGALGNGTRQSLSGWLGYLMEFREFMPSTPLRLVKSAPPAAMMYHKELFARYGGYEEDEVAEDLLFHWKVTQAGESVLFDPAIVATHLNRTGWRQVFTYQAYLGRISAVARKRSQQTGYILIRYPALVALMPAFRLLRMIRWMAVYDRKTLLALLIAWPLILIGLIFWSFGFWREARRQLA